jgi:hypothetical protein
MIGCKFIEFFSLRSYIGEFQAIKSAMGPIKDVVGIADTVYGWYDKAQNRKLAKEQFGVQKEMAEQQMKTVEEQKERQKKIRNFMLRGNW